MPKPELKNSWVENIPCTNKTRQILLFIMYVVFLKITSFLRIILTFHSGHTNLFLETVTIKFMGPRGRRAEGPRVEKSEHPHTAQKLNCSVKDLLNF